MDNAADHSKKIAAALSVIKQDYSPECLRMASTSDYVTDAIGQLIDAGLVATPQQHAQPLPSPLLTRAAFMADELYELYLAEREAPLQQQAQAELDKVMVLAWKWHHAAVKDGFACSEPAQELFDLLGWPDAPDGAMAAQQDQKGGATLVATISATQPDPGKYGASANRPTEAFAYANKVTARRPVRLDDSDTPNDWSAA